MWQLKDEAAAFAFDAAAMLCLYKHEERRADVNAKTLAYMVALALAGKDLSDF